jgi:hypothetical protein
MRSRLNLLLATVATVAFAAQTPADSLTCRSRADLTGACFTVHGALRYYNGAPAVRIWRIGTSRLLGIHGLDERGLPGPGACSLPAGLRNSLEAGKEVIADFVVCPLTKSRSGVMQMVCVDFATNIRAKAYRF